MKAETEYLKSLVRQFWDYAEANFSQEGFLLETNHCNELRPPVFRKGNETQNLIFPTDEGREVHAAFEVMIPPKERHRWFRSMKSSQAVAQSVFGNLMVLRKLGLLDGLESDQGLPAFSKTISKSKTQLEHSITHLGEPRPTSIDFWIDGAHRVAVECKLTEKDFGSCSRPRLREGKDHNFLRDHCDGNYTRQRGRQSRCSLTEIGVDYWRYVPHLFKWSNDENHIPCPLKDTYQLVRNVLASSVNPDGQIDVKNFHALIIYDARNPSFQTGGVAHAQWKSAREALKFPELLRSCSWQAVVKHLRRSGEVDWLLDQLNEKYGF